MKLSVANTNAARQVELIIRKLTSLSTLPGIAVNFLAELSRQNISLTALAEIVESDAALTARILSLAKDSGIETTSATDAVKKLPLLAVRDAILSVKVFQTFDADRDPDKNRPLPRKQLALHTLGVACCARKIAELMSPPNVIDPQMAFAAPRYR